MDNTMPKDNFLQPLLDLMNKRMDTIEQKVDDNTQTTQKVLDEAQYTNGRVTSVEAAVKRLETSKGKKLDLPPNVIYLIAVGAVILLAVVATLLHINLGNLL